KRIRNSLSRDGIPMSDESKLELIRKDENPLLAISRTRSEIIARGRTDAAALAVRPVDDILAALRKSLANVGQKSEEQRQAELREDQRLAAQGDLNAQIALGSYYWGKDHAESAKWYRKAAEQGDAIAQFEIGEMCRQGKGLPQDYSQALQWLRKS